MLDGPGTLLRPGKRGRRSTEANTPRPSPRKAKQRRNAVHAADHGRHVYAKMGRSKECTFCIKFVSRPPPMVASTRDQRTDSIGLHVCISCWDTKGFRLWHDFGEKRATTYLTDGMMCQDKDDFSAPTKLSRGMNSNHWSRRVYRGRFSHVHCGLPAHREVAPV
jgi:hypothetical protein